MKGRKADETWKSLLDWIGSLHFNRSLRAPRCADLTILFDALYHSMRLVEEPNDLASDVLPPRLLVVHDAGGSGEDDVAKLTRGQELDDPLLHLAQLDIVPRADNASLVEAGNGVSMARQGSA